MAQSPDGARSGRLMGSNDPGESRPREAVKGSRRDSRATSWTLSRSSPFIASPVIASRRVANSLDTVQTPPAKEQRPSRYPTVAPFQLLSFLCRILTMPSLRSQLLACLLLGLVSGRKVPTNVKNFYDTVVAQGECIDKLASGFHSIDGDSGSKSSQRAVNGSWTVQLLMSGIEFSYCGDHVNDYNVIYIQGKNGTLANLDVDCDGIQGSQADDGRCGSSDDTQSITSFQDIVQGYKTGQKDLDSNIHPYVVFGNEGTKKHWHKFDPQDYGIKPLSIMAVVCNNKLVCPQTPGFYSFAHIQY